jgi:tRNA G18 (ribose-2'-O)-methylase SpoU
MLKKPVVGSSTQEIWLSVHLQCITSPNNVRAIFRSAAALDIDAVLIPPRCGDPLYRRSVRVSMGTVFQVPWARLESWPQDLTLLQGEGFTLAAVDLAVKIPLRPGVDSLNVAAASAVAFWELRPRP